MIDLRHDILKAINDGKGYYHDGVDYSYYSFVFDPKYYASCYPDIKQETNGDNKKLFEHFLTFGIKNCMKGSKDFDVMVYKVNNPDLSFGTEWSSYYRHFCEVGRFENREHV